jgi:hypothetical protein
VSHTSFFLVAKRQNITRKKQEEEKNLGKDVTENAWKKLKSSLTIT